MAKMSRETPKEDTYNCYGGASRQVEIEELEDHGVFRRALRKDVPKDEVCINGRFVYTTKHKPMEAGHPRTASYRRPKNVRCAFLREMLSRR